MTFNEPWDCLQESPFDLEGTSPDDLACPDAVQAGVHVLLLDPGTLCAVAMSAGCQALLAVPLQEALGQPLGLIWQAPSAQRLTQLLRNSSAEQLGAALVASTGQRLWVSSFRSEERIGLLLEPIELDSQIDTDDPSEAELLKLVAATSSAGTAPSMDAFIEQLAGLIRQLVGFERVMVYRFDTDWNGTVVAESREATLESSYLGLRFPASDIPPAARALFDRVAVRPSVDVSVDPLPLIYAADQPDRADLSDCPYRAVAPVHRTYLQNMGVRSSLTLSLSVNGRLWGLLACHHLSGVRQLNPVLLALMRSVATIGSIALTRLVEREQYTLLEQVQQISRWLQQEAAAATSFDVWSVLLEPLQPLLQGLMGCSALALSRDGAIERTAAAPSSEAIGRITALVQRWSEQHGQPVLATARLSAFALELDDADAGRAAGVLAVSGPACLLLFRQPVQQPTTWAGDPDQRVVRLPGGAGLDPRSSFEAFVALHHGASRAWNDSQLQAALLLRDGLDQAISVLRIRHDAQQLEQARLDALRLQAEMVQAALHDPLTGLANRRQLYTALQGGRFPADQLALLHLDLDGFKAVNDSYGHAMGDLLLERLAAILKACVRESDLVVRLGGDEFAVLTPAGEKQHVLDALCRRLIAAVSRPQVISGQICEVGLSIGIALADRHGVDPARLLAESDRALYESKKAGRGRYTFYSDRLAAAFRSDLELADELRAALADQQLQAFYQPQFDVDSGVLVGAEALLRWRHPRLGLLLPDQFLPVAQRMRLLRDVDQCMLSLIEADYQHWQAQGLQLECLGVNLSREQLLSEDFLERIQALQVPRHLLAVELRESTYLQRPNSGLLQILKQLKALGIRLVLDDFGTGLSSLRSLLAVQPDALKLDKDLVIPALESPETRRLLQLVVRMAHALDLEITAEGVQDAGHQALVRELTCRRMQGYGLAEPMDASAFLAFAQDERPLWQRQ